MNIDTLLNIMYERGGSDLHLRVGSPPLLRVDGVLEQLEGERLGVADLKEMQELVLTPKQAKLLDDELAVDSSYSIEGFKRFRINGRLGVFINHRRKHFQRARFHGRFAIDGRTGSRRQKKT